MSYASRLQRLAGWLIELAVVLLFFLIGVILSGGSFFAVIVIGLTASWLYFAGFESSGAQATLS